MRKLTIAAFALLLLAADDPGAIVKYRQASMKALGQHMTACSLVVKHEIASRADLAAHAAAIAETSKNLPQWFPAGTGSDRVRTDAKPDIWRRRKDFEASAARLQREAAKLAAIARTSDAKAFDAQFKVVGESCNQCHDAFRVHD
jgi:cytochrome c556